MLTMAVGQSDDLVATDAIAEAINQCRAGLAGRTPQAALLFVAFELFDPSIPAAVRDAFPGIELVGTTAAGEMSSIGGFTEDGVTLVVFDSDDVEIAGGVGAQADLDPKLATRAAAEMARARTHKPPSLAMMFADPLAAQDAIAELCEALGTDITVVGGAASGATLTIAQPNFQFHNETVVENGVAVLLFSDPIVFSVAVGTGLRPIGPRGVVTKSSRGLIEEIDGHPAEQFIAPYVASVGPASIGNPLALRDEGTADWYLRAMLSKDPETGAVFIPGSVPVGAHAQLATASTDEIVRVTGDVMRRASESFPSSAVPRGALLFSCAVRKFMLGTRTGEEVAEARTGLPANLPVAGMYCVGEIAPPGEDTESRLHNQTFVALLLGD